MLIAVLSCFSSLPRSGSWRSDTLPGDVSIRLRESLLFLAVLLPFAAALSAVLDGRRDRWQDLQGGAGQQHGGDPRVSLLPLVTILNEWRRSGLGTW